MGQKKTIHFFNGQLLKTAVILLLATSSSMSTLWAQCSFTTAANKITAPKCVEIGKQYSITIDNTQLRKVKWGLPQGMKIVSLDKNAPIIDVLIDNTYAQSGNITASNLDPYCSPNYNSQITPPALQQKSPILVSGPLYYVPGVNVYYESDASATAGRSWTFPTGFVVQKASASGGSMYVTPGTTGGKVTISVISSAACQAPAPYSFNVTPVIALPTSYIYTCTGTPLKLTCTPVNGATYSWTGPNGFTSTEQNPTVTNSATIGMNESTYFLTITINGVKSKPAPCYVYVAHSPSEPIAIATPSCFKPGSPVTYSVVAPPNGGYASWTVPAGFSLGNQSAQSSITLTPAIGTKEGYITVVIRTAPYCKTSQPLTFKVTPTPDKPVLQPITIFCDWYGGGTLRGPAVPGGVSYMWTGPNNFTSNLQNPYIPYSTPPKSLAGIYYLTLSSSGCNSEVTSTTVVERSISQSPCAARVGDLETPKTVSVYPNPAENEITISVVESMIGSEYSIINYTGAIVKKGTFSTLTDNINISNWNPGVYIISYVVNDTHTSIKFIVR